MAEPLNTEQNKERVLLKKFGVDRSWFCDLWMNVPALYQIQEQKQLFHVYSVIIWEDQN